MHINAVFAGIAVTDIDAAVEWYESFLAGALADGGLCEPLEITHGDTVRFTQVADPDRNTLTLVESPTRER